MKIEINNKNVDESNAYQIQQLSLMELVSKHADTIALWWMAYRPQMIWPLSIYIRTIYKTMKKGY